VLDLFEEILRKEKERLKNEGKINESVLHNLIFQQSSDNPEKSDLWLINEDFIYFKGFSETRLCDATIEGEKIFKEEFSKIEQEHINANRKKD